MTAWFSKLSNTGKSLSVIGAALVLGIAIAASGYFALPAQVELNTIAISGNLTDIHEISRTLGDILCILTQSPGANPLDCVVP